MKEKGGPRIRAAFFFWLELFRVEENRANEGSGNLKSEISNLKF
jgi:hypothetical protein